MPLAVSTNVYHAGMIILLVLGFGFVIFWHELGHFLAAKWVGIKVEQFAVGFGHAVFAWRKGIGFRAGNTQKAYQEAIERHLAAKEGSTLQIKERLHYTDREASQAASELGLGETEYRLNWIPLGGYVKMLGQDDLRPDAAADDPRAYNRKSVSARMLVISAGVIMNVILAAIMFVAVFLIGLKAPPAWVGNVVSQSPAQIAGVKVGDQIQTFNGRSEEEFTKITLDTALAKDGETVPMTVERPQGKSVVTETLQITPRRPEGNSRGFVGLGIEPPMYLRGLNKEDAEGIDVDKVAKDFSPEATLVRPDDVVTAVNGTPVSDKDYVVLDNAVQQFGKRVELTVRTADGQTRQGSFQPHFARFFDEGFELAGMEPRALITTVVEDSLAHDKLFSGDVITGMTRADGAAVGSTSRMAMMDALRKVGSSGEKFDITVLRGNESKTIQGLRATADVGEQKGQKGLGVVLAFDEAHPALGNVDGGSPAAQAGLKIGDTIASINGQPVSTWYDIHRILSQAQPDAELQIGYVRDKHPANAVMKLPAAALQVVRNVRYHHDLMLLEPYTIVRRAQNPWIAVKWGVVETRDFILQFYITIRRMFEGSVALSNMMGPVGIFRGGVKFAFKGTDWLLWFLAMISANLAVVNFLPIPVVDGGQFVFLILEKIKGKPLSPKTMAIAQYVGLAFLAAVVVFVTYHDIIRRYQ